MEGPRQPKNRNMWKTGERQGEKAGENFFSEKEREGRSKKLGSGSRYRKQDTGGNKLGMVIQHSAAVFACVKAVKNSVAIW